MAVATVKRKVVFHVVMSPEFRQDPDEDVLLSLYLMFQPHKKSNFVDTIQLKQERDLENGYTLLIGNWEYQLEPHTDVELMYTYHSRKWSVKSTAGHGAYRSLLISKPCEVWHQFDYPIFVRRGNKDAIVESITDLSPNSKDIGESKLALRTYMESCWTGFVENTPSLEATDWMQVDPSEAVKLCRQIIRCFEVNQFVIRENRMKGDAGFVYEDVVTEPLRRKPPTFITNQVVQDFLIQRLHTLKQNASLAPYNRLSEGMLDARLLHDAGLFEQISDINRRMLCELLRFPSMGVDECQQLLTRIEGRFGSRIGIFISGIRALIQSMPETSFEWMLALPLLHFLRGDSKPHQHIFSRAFETHKSIERWWGVYELNKKDRSKWREQREITHELSVVVDQLEEMFEVDRLLPHAVVWLHLTVDGLHDLLDFEWSKKIPTYLQCAAIAHVCKDMKTIAKRDESSVKKLSRCITQLTNTIRMKKSLEPERLSEEERNMLRAQMNSSTELIRTLTIKISEREHLKLLLFATENLGICHSVCKHFNIDGTDFPYDVLKPVVKCVKKKLPKDPVAKSKGLTYEYEEEPKVWKDFMNVSQYFTEDIATIWLERCHRKFKKRISKIKDEDKVILLCNTEATKDYNQKMVQIVTEAAYDALEKICSKKGKRQEGLFASLFDNKDFCELLSDKIVESWPKKHWNYQVLRHILRWPPFKMLMKTGIRGLHFMQNEAKEMVRNGKRTFSSTVEALSDGSITVQELEVIIANQESFSVLYQIHSGEAEQSEAKKDLIKRREKEVNAWKMEKQLTRDLYHILSDPKIGPVDTQLIEGRLKEGTSDYICLKEIQDISCEDQPRIIYFNHSPDVQELLPQISKSHSSMVYMSQLEAKAKEHRGDVDEREITIDEFVRSIWKPVHDELSCAAESVLDGTISLAKLQTLFTRGVDDVENDVKSMFKVTHINTDADIIKEELNQRCSQIKNFIKVQNLREVVRVFDTMKEKLTLNGEYQVLEELVMIANIDTSYTLGSVTDSVIAGVTEMEFWEDEKRSNFLKQLKNTLHVAMWIRSEFKDIQSLDVFAELAGESEADFDRVLSFHDAVMGYAPIVFGLKDESDLPKLTKACNSVFENVQDNKFKLATEWEVIDIEWLKQVQKQLDKSPTEQAKDINTRGFYKLGKYVQKNGTTSADFFTITVNEDQQSPAKLDKETPAPTPSHDQIQAQQPMGMEEPKTRDKAWLLDLESKLSLLAGREEADTKEHKTHFTKVFDAIQEIETTSAQLCRAGNILFLEWGAILRCNFQERPGDDHSGDMDECSSQWNLKSAKRPATVKETDNVDIEIDFGTDQVLKGNGPITDILHHLQDFMDECLAEWNDEVQKKRDHHYYLNHYTTEQLLQLSKLLVNYKQLVRENSKELTDLHALLSKVTPGLTWECLDNTVTSAITEATEEIMEHRELQATPEQADDHDQASARWQKIKAKAAELQKKTMFPETVLIAAIQAKGSTELKNSAYISWCNKHSKDIQEQPAKATANWQEAVSEKLTSASRRPLKNQLQILSNAYRESVKCANTKEYLSFEYIGFILKNLAMKAKGVEERHRPPSLSHEDVNVVVCESDLILSNILVLYQDGPLPTENEVLLCNSSTSQEQVKLLLMRANGDTSSQLFCLAFADLLDYSISEDVVEFILTSSAHLRLVIFCSTEHGRNSHLVTALDRFRMEMTDNRLGSLKPNYLLDQFRKRAHPVKGVEPAALIGSHQSTVEVVVSNRSGQGKSLYVERYKEKLKMNYPDADTVTLPLHDGTVDQDMVVDALLRNFHRSTMLPRIYHIDIAPMVRNGLDKLLFNLLVLGSLTTTKGQMWKASPIDLFLVEMTDLQGRLIDGADEVPDATFYSRLPKVICHSPKEVCDDQICTVVSENDGIRLDDISLHEHDSAAGICEETTQHHDIDSIVFMKDCIQRPFQYLCHYEEDVAALESDTGKLPERRLSTLDKFEYCTDNKNQDRQKIIETLFRHCGIVDPSWAELSHFANFLNQQLQAYEGCDFCQPNMIPLFRDFVVKFLVVFMSKEFATPSFVDMSDSTPPFQAARPLAPGQETTDSLDLYQIRQWESQQHPFLFFNGDRATFTFVGFALNEHGMLLNQDSSESEEAVVQIMHGYLKDLLEDQGVNLSKHYESYGEQARKVMLQDLYRVLMSDASVYDDPDPHYKLTLDNVTKILAINMRFRCGIPVVLMGETGCGKTSLIRFMCKLLAAKQRDAIKKQRQQRQELETMRTQLESMESGAITELHETIERQREAVERRRVEIEETNGARKQSFKNNMVLMKVHGGTTSNEIVQKVEYAEKLALENQTKYGVDTVLFFDEANTTQAVGLIKEIMCDDRVQGRPINLAAGGLKIVAACNPYRKHTEGMIQKMKSAGLGYHVSQDNIEDTYNTIPLRELVYRVQALPPSLQPLVWDFGKLSHSVESVYIKEIVEHYIRHIEPSKTEIQIISNILSAAQEFMRKQRDECSFVSLRDVKRCMKVFVWFWEHGHLFGLQQFNIPRVSCSLVLGLAVSYHARLQEKEDQDATPQDADQLTDSGERRVQASRRQFREYITKKFDKPFNLPPVKAATFLGVITRCQDALLANLDLGPTIARNAALKENVFMMVICIELRIPLFLVGKPGSSKSLAKSIVAKAMKGAHNLKSSLYKNLKQVHMISYQCSPLSTSKGIINTFQRCKQFQEKKDSQRFVSVVVLDEVGLAEDAPKMPLKALHPLLEEGSIDEKITVDEDAGAIEPTSNEARDAAGSSGTSEVADRQASGDVEGMEKVHTESNDAEEEDGGEGGNESTSVAFIGLSNWALDPAKMNRGIMVCREDPGEKELIETARGICSSDDSQDILPLLDNVITQLARGYLEVYRKTSKPREFFGLRDYYSLIKMVCGFCRESKKKPIMQQLEYCVRRNFNGLLDTFHPWEIFKAYIKTEDTDSSLQHKQDVKVLDFSPASFLKDNLDGYPEIHGDHRYLLVVTENFAGLSILQKHILTQQDVIVIFGSSFPKDQKYTEVCRNINSIKVCMELGHTVILLNLENLYESLYDALNQYYVYYNEQRYVDLGLGTHRVKCRVHDNTRLIVVSGKEVVQRFGKDVSKSTLPIALNNRLEKHILDTAAMLSHDEKCIVDEIETWIIQFTTINVPRSAMTTNLGLRDAFVGYHSDMVANFVFQYCAEHEQHTGDEEWAKKVTTTVQTLLLQCATPEAILRLKYSHIGKELQKDYFDQYFNQQHHDSLADYLQGKIGTVSQSSHGLRVQVTTHSSLLERNEDLRDIRKRLDLEEDSLVSNHLLSFQTQQQFREKVSTFLRRNRRKRRLLLVQCLNGQKHRRLIACALYCIQDELRLASKECEAGTTNLAHIVLVVSLARLADKYSCFQGDCWEFVHIDDVRGVGSDRPSIKWVQNMRVSSIFDTDECDSVDEQISPGLLIKSSLLKAAGLISDSLHCSQRTVERIDILRSVVGNHSPGEGTFLSVIMKRLSILLKEQEHRSPNPDQWIYNIAIRVADIHESGTFRRAVWQQLQDKIAPFLAEIVAFCDSYNNLDLIKNSERNSWEHRVWLGILEDTSISHIAYEDLYSREGAGMREKAPVKSGSIDGRVICTNAPFTWLIKDAIDKIGSEASALQALSDKPKKDQLLDMIQNSPIGKRLQVILTRPEDRQLFVSAYLKDFTRMAYSAESKTPWDELEIVESGLKSATKHISQRNHLTPAREDVLSGILAIHIAHSHVEERLNRFSLLVRAYPSLLNAKFEDDTEDTNDEMTIDIKAVEILVSEALPEPLEEGELDTLEKQKDWLQTLQIVKMPIQEIIQSVICNPDPDVYGPSAIEVLREHENKWQKLRVIELFLVHVSQQMTDSDVAVKMANQVSWTFDEAVDMKTEDDVQNLQESLKKATEFASTDQLKFGVNLCAICLCDITEPVELPCKHIFCHQCITGWWAGRRERQCPTCNESVNDNFEVASSSEGREALVAFATFCRYRNAFFLDVITQLAFSKGEPPQDEVFRGLLRYVTRTAEDISASEEPITFDEECIDPDPAIKTVVMQLLLKSNQREVFKYVQNSLADVWQKAYRPSPHEATLNLCLTYVYCLEELFICQASGTDKQTLVLEAGMKLAEAVDMLKHQHPDSLNADRLEAIAKARFGLNVTADCIRVHVQENGQEPSPPGTKELFQTAKDICEAAHGALPQSYLSKQLFNVYGPSVLAAVARDPTLQWAIPRDLIQAAQQVPGHLVVCGEDFLTVRDAIHAAVTQEKLIDDKELSKLTSPRKSQLSSILLSLFHEVTLQFGSISSSSKDNLKNFLDNLRHLNITHVKDFPQSFIFDFALRLVHNSMFSLEGRELVITRNQSRRDTMIITMIIHAVVTVLCAYNSGPLCFLKKLVSSPQDVESCFFPTMCDINYDDLARVVGSGNWFECPNGHPYYIGDSNTVKHLTFIKAVKDNTILYSTSKSQLCGRPWIEERCGECGAVIGGKRHIPAEGNRRLRINYRFGHILGDHHAQLPTRDPNVAIIRIIIHSLMLAACMDKPKVVRNMVSPNPASKMGEFLWQHIELNIRDLGSVLNLQEDDCILLMHIILNHMLKCNRQESTSSKEARVQGQTRKQRQEGASSSASAARQHSTEARLNLNSVEDTRVWKDKFTKTFVEPIVEDMNAQLGRAKDAMKTDRLSDIEKDKYSNVSKVLSERPDCQGVTLESMKDPASLPIMWQYQPHITVDTLSTYMKQRPNCRRNYKLLTAFLDKVDLLVLLRNLPDILHLQELLYDRFNFCIGLKEAKDLKVVDFLDQLESESRETFERLIAIFVDTWNKVRAHLKTFVVTRKHPQDNTMTMAHLCDESLDKKRLSVAMLLPTLTKDGVCSIGLAKFLIRVHNDFIEMYRGLEPLQIRPPEIKVSMVTVSHLAAVDTEKALLPAIRTHCHCDLITAEQRFNLSGLQRSIEDTFVRGRPLIDETLELLMFREGSLNKTAFHYIQTNISQEPLSLELGKDILTELNPLTVLCDCLNVLDIAIGFIASSQGLKPTTPIKDYLQNYLRFSEDKLEMLKSKVQNRCSLMHILDLWRLLSVARAKQRLQKNQDPFEDVEKVFLNEFTAEEETLLEGALQQVDMMDIEELLGQLYQYIELNLKSSASHSEFDLQNWSIYHVLCDVPGPEIRGLDNIPQQITLAKSVSLWKFTANFQEKRRKTFMKEQ